MQLHRQLAGMRAEHTATVTAAQAPVSAGVDGRIADAQPTEQPEQQSATSASLRSACIGCAALFATSLHSTQPVSTARAQEELSQLSDKRIEAGDGDRSSLPAANTAHLALQQQKLVATAAAAQAAPGEVGTPDGDSAAGNDVSLLHSWPEHMGSHHPAQASNVEDSLPLTRDQATISARASLPVVDNSTVSDMEAAKVFMNTPPAQEEGKADCAALLPAAGSPNSRHSGNLQRHKPLLAAANNGLAPTKDASEHRLAQLTDGERSMPAVRTGSGATVCKASVEHEAEEKPGSHRSVADMFASLSYLQDSMAGPALPACPECFDTHDAEGEPAYKKRRAEVS